MADCCAHGSENCVLQNAGNLSSKRETVKKNSRLGCHLCNRVSDSSCVPDGNAVYLCTILFMSPLPHEIIPHSTTGGVRTLPRFNCSRLRLKCDGTRAET